MWKQFHPYFSIREIPIFPKKYFSKNWFTLFEIQTSILNIFQSSKNMR